ncbi:hypothetical protein KC19_7G069700 [Ceratodon purpureus]|uniref:Polygalacturonase n=1 Tax=Ceratodon purpureus TaxID=3225 RepID=A0A8T0H371_CERPU|nr:hypothetical protein KC19_7G069700 [Ceratodon purpureus]
MAEWMRGRRRGVVGVDGRDLFVLVLAVTVCVATRTSEAAFTNFAKTSRSNNGITTMSSGGQSSSDAVFNIRTFGAHGNGASDDTKAFLAAWAKACKSGGVATVLVPSGYSFVLGSNTQFVGKGCTSKIVVQVDGNILGPGDKSKWQNAKSASAAWMQFTDCKDVTIQGTGTLDARGQSFWPSGNGGPIGIRFLRGTNIAVLGVTIKNTPQVSVKLNFCNGGLIQGVSIINPADSPNTDGIHLQTNVYNVQILDCIIKTGDDCISIGTGTHNVIIRNILCGPGHGISIGSLGNKGLLACVSDIDISQVTFVGTLAGCRIKTCAGGKGKAARISYRDIKVEGVKYPIHIDQYYCGKGTKSENVILDQIEFYNIKGTAAKGQIPPVYLDCAAPGCTNVRLQNVQIDYAPGAYCSNSYGTYGGVMHPAGCLQYKLNSQSRSAPGCGV